MADDYDCRFLALIHINPLAAFFPFDLLRFDYNTQPDPCNKPLWQKMT